MPTTVALPFTNRTYVALAIARGIASGRGHSDVTATHVALGILREGENIAVATLYDGGVSLRQLRHELESALPPHGHPHFHSVQLPTTESEQAIVEIASAEAELLDAQYVGCEHLLLALTRDPGTETAQILARRGFGYDAAVSQLRAFYEKSRDA